jgi:hypothetical protein
VLSRVKYSRTRRRCESGPAITARPPTRSVVGPDLDFQALDLLAGNLLFDRLQEPFQVLGLVVLSLELAPGELADQSLGERPLLVTDLRLGAPVDLDRVVNPGGEVEPLEEEAVLVPSNKVSTAAHLVWSSPWTRTR